MSDLGGYSLIEVKREISRRAFAGQLFKGTVIAAVLDRVGPGLKAADVTPDEKRLAFDVYSTIGMLTIPADEDPGWTDFDPGISEYGLYVFMQTIFLGGNDTAFQAFERALIDLNKFPRVLGYGVDFLKQSRFSQTKYLTDILTGQFENDGYQDILAVAGGLSIVSAKLTFFSNYPRHKARPGQEFQVLPPSQIKTGWDIMRYKGPVGPEEERALREKYKDIQIVPGIDTRNPYI